MFLLAQDYITFECSVTQQAAYLIEFFFSDSWRGIEEVQHLGRTLDAIFLCCLWVGEAVVAIAHKILVGTCSIWELMWVWNFLQERLLGDTENKQN